LRTGELLLSGGDDCNLLLWPITGQPVPINGYVQCLTGHRSNIFAAQFSESDTHVVSGGNDHRVYYHDVQRPQPLISMETHTRAVLSVDFVPDSAVVFASAGMDHALHLWDARASAACVGTRRCGGVVGSVHFNRAHPHLAAISSQDAGVQVLDMRMLWGAPSSSPSPLHCYEVGVDTPATRVVWNETGRHICCSLESYTPLLLDAHCRPLCRFDDEAFANRITMKGVSFAGPDDGWLLSGSDDFRIYLWRIPPEVLDTTLPPLAHHVLSDVPVVTEPQILLSHRSIVNSVQYHRGHNMVFSAGVEKVVKGWTLDALREEDLIPIPFRQRTICTSMNDLTSLPHVDDHNECPYTLGLFDLDAALLDHPFDSEDEFMYMLSDGIGEDSDDSEDDDVAESDDDENSSLDDRSD